MTLTNEQLLQFKKDIDTIRLLNGGQNTLYLFYKNGEWQITETLSAYDLKGFDYICPLVERHWVNLGYHNHGLLLAGMYDKNLKLIENLPLAPQKTLENIKFTTDGYYDEYNPIITICENGETKDIGPIKESQNYKDKILTLLNNC